MPLVSLTTHKGLLDGWHNKPTKKCLKNVEFPGTFGVGVISYEIGALLGSPKMLKSTAM